MSVSRPGSLSRVENADQGQQLLGLDGRSDLHADRVGDAAEVFHVGAADRPGAIADPGEVGAEIVPLRPPRHPPRLRLLVGQMEPFVAGEEFRPRQLVEPPPGDGFHEVHRVGDGAR